MNMQQLTVTINAAKSAYPSEAKTPVSIVARNILQYASTLDEAIAIARRFDMFVSESFLVSSGKEGKAVIIEKSPEKTDVFYPDSTLLFCSNHFQSKALKADEKNVAFMKNSSTVYRFKRLEQLTAGLHANPSNVAAILRNPYGIDGKKIGWGNEDALNQFIAHHGVIFKPASGEMWVSSSPYQVGTLVYFNLNDIFNHRGYGLNRNKNIAADTQMVSTIVRPYWEFKSLVDSIKNANKPISDLTIGRMVSLNPDYYYGYEIAGDYYFTLGRKESASKNYNKSLQCVIPNLLERKAIEKKLLESNKR